LSQNHQPTGATLILGDIHQLITVEIIIDPSNTSNAVGALDLNLGAPQNQADDIMFPALNAIRDNDPVFWSEAQITYKQHDGTEEYKSGK